MDNSCGELVLPASSSLLRRYFGFTYQQVQLPADWMGSHAALSRHALAGG